LGPTLMWEGQRLEVYVRISFIVVNLHDLWNNYPRSIWHVIVVVCEKWGSNLGTSLNSGSMFPHGHHVETSLDKSGGTCPNFHPMVTPLYGWLNASVDYATTLLTSVRASVCGTLPQISDMNLINATLLLAHFLIRSNISYILCVPMSMYFMILCFSWCFKFTLCKHVRLSYVLLINLLTYFLTYSWVRRQGKAPQRYSGVFYDTADFFRNFIYLLLDL